jgi:hypothetical protein
MLLLFAVFQESCAQMVNMHNGSVMPRNRMGLSREIIR